MMKLFFCFIFSILIIQPAYAEDTIKIGFIGPQTGRAAFLAIDSVEVIKNVFQEQNQLGGINGKKLQLVVEDDMYETARAVTAYQKLVQKDKIKILFMFTYGAVIALADQARRDGVLIIDTLDCDEQIGSLPENIFCVAKKTEDLGILNAEHALKHKYLPAGIIYAEGDPFLPKVAQATKDKIEAGKGSVLVYEGVSPNTQDLRPLLLKLKQKKVESVFLYGYDDFGLALRQASELGIKAKFYLLSSVNSPGFQQSAGSTVQGVYASGWFAPKTVAYEKFMQEFKSRNSRQPLLEISTIPSYDVAHLLVTGLSEAIDTTGIVNIEKLSKFLYSIKEYQGVSGPITMDSDGAVRSLVSGIYIYDNGKFLPVE